MSNNRRNNIELIRKKEYKKRIKKEKEREQRRIEKGKLR